MSENDKYTFWINDPTILYKNNKFLEFIPTKDMDRILQLNAITRFCIYFIVLALIMEKSSFWIQIPILIIFFMICLYFVFKFDKEGMKNEVYRMRGIDINSLGDQDYPENKDEDQEHNIIESGYYDSDNRLMVGKYLSSHQPEKKKLKISLEDYTEFEKKMCRKPSKENPFMNPLLNDITTYPNPQPTACNADDEDIKNDIVDCYNEDLYRDVSDLWERQNSQRQFYTVPQTYPNDQKSFAEWCYKSDNICKVDQSQCLKNEDLRYKRLSGVNY
jgi:hypothetical protein